MIKLLVAQVDFRNVVPHAAIEPARNPEGLDRLHVHPRAEFCQRFRGLLFLAEGFQIAHPPPAREPHGQHDEHERAQADLRSPSESRGGWHGDGVSWGRHQR